MVKLFISVSKARVFALASQSLSQTAFSRPKASTSLVIYECEDGKDREKVANLSLVFAPKLMKISPVSLSLDENLPRSLKFPFLMCIVLRQASHSTLASEIYQKVAPVRKARSPHC
jgi:hypothetical protein